MSAAAAKGRLLAIVPSDRAERLAFTRQAASTRRIGVRRYEGAQISRLTASWRAGSASLDEDLRRDLDALRNRSRDLFKNDSYAAKFGRMVRNNVVGAQGFVLQAAAIDGNGKADALANRAIEDAWYQQCRPGNWDVTGKFDASSFWRMLATGLAEDGEILIRKVRQRGRGAFNYQLQAMDPARIDTTYNVERTGNSNAIIMGVEVDDFRKPVAYHLRKIGQTVGPRERVPASEMIHWFIPLAAEQTRGVPWLHAAMHLLRQLGGYREAAVIAARIGASKMGFYKRRGDTPPPNEGEDESGNFIQSAEPGTFEVIPDDYELDKWDPTYPHDQFDVFCKATLRGISSGIGVDYPTLGNDLEAVNFSSMRGGVQDTREEWMVIQDAIIACVVTQVYEEWLGDALMQGLIKLPNGSVLPATKVDKFRAHSFQARRWPWVDPLKDMQANVMAIDNLLASPQQIAAQQGRDIVDVLDDIQRFNQLLDERGLKKPAPKPAAQVQQPAEETEEEEA